MIGSVTALIWALINKRVLGQFAFGLVLLEGALAAMAATNVV